MIPDDTLKRVPSVYAVINGIIYPPNPPSHYI